MFSPAAVYLAMDMCNYQKGTVSGQEVFINTTANITCTIVGAVVAIGILSVLPIPGVDLACGTATGTAVNWATRWALSGVFSYWQGGEHEQKLEQKSNYSDDFTKDWKSTPV